MSVYSVIRDKELKEILDLIPCTVEFRMSQREKAAENVSLNQKIPECPSGKLFFILPLKTVEFLYYLTEGLPGEVPEKWMDFPLLQWALSVWIL